MGSHTSDSMGNPRFYLRFYSNEWILLSQILRGKNGLFFDSYMKKTELSHLRSVRGMGLTTFVSVERMLFQN